MRCPRCGGRSTPRTIPEELRRFTLADAACKACISALKRWVAEKAAGEAS